MSTPTSTYRIQFRNGMTFDRAAALVPYMQRLGISHFYASPIFTAAPGSTHGYDVADANEIDPELGGREGFDRLSAALKQAGLGLILDIVPNHMAAALENRWWRSIIEWGRESAYAHFFDVNWSRRLTLPFLGDTFEKVLNERDLSLRLDREAGCLTLSYFDSHYPLLPSTYGKALDGIDLPLAQSILACAESARPDDEQAFHSRMRDLLASPDMQAQAEALQARLDEVSKDCKRLDDLHDAQAFRLISWRDAPRDLSYRRFFEITGLAGLRVEDPAVFAESHRLILDLVRSGQVDGLRVDHVDGLSDPGGYLERLRKEAGPDCYLIVEKILADKEQLPAEWPIAGTTGYEFISALSNVMLEPSAPRRFQDDYASLTGRPLDLLEEIRAAKGLMADVNFAGESARLLELAIEMAADNTDDAPLSQEDLRHALRELLITFPVYRTYGTESGLSSADRQRLDDVMEAVRKGPSPAKPEALAFLGRIMTGDVAPASQEGARMFRTRFQQLTGPLMAKSIEDTLFYRINPLLALNEVGSEPHGHAFGIDAFHEAMQDRQKTQPLGLSATSTHDTKRGEDARARLYALSEAPELWQEALHAWRAMNEKATVSLNDGTAPEPSVEWLIYQALIGVWPQGLAPDDADGLKALEERFLPYIEKSLREAKLRTSWNDQNLGYEKSVTSYARHLFSEDALEFRRDFISRTQGLRLAGAVNSVTQTLIKLTAPGIPDIYQGSEGLDLSLVDPDNRRMPDFDALSKVSGDDLTPAGTSAWLDGRLKAQLVARLLPDREKRADLYLRGDYHRIDAKGAAAEHVVGYSRSHGQERLVVLVPRLLFKAVGAQGTTLPDAGFWQDTTVSLPDGLAGTGYRNLLTGEPVAAQSDLPLAQLFKDQPFAVLTSGR
ncbi:malto-oligosyltrehalose synthase [Rhizobium sp. SSA_523]|uniref:malto-oligosyltrehalose synthase n=1 Tax=Rhizobium sp. SSA_523 TaxID=2952477 RepID=UPI0020916AA6|nr:malto-oligosyltrehalose synthase [Rhizobium sp. SSA_523]MCO5732027.1 malto-oligosyltrehalose synthase [Rhizobium sp. SSA_523]WKC22635.1 malto-oligosyltrehalose synthase [Rhizobium sp. SSA_523]